MSRVTISKDAGVAHVLLSRPDKMNAIDSAMFDELCAAGDKLAADTSLRCVVLSGKGRGFCTGLDVASFLGVVGDSTELDKFLATYPDSPANRAQQAVYAWTALPVPVIAAIHGVCFGGGLQIALGADIRVASPKSRLSVMEVKWGLIPDMTGVQRMLSLVRADVARELIYSGRVFEGTEAQQLGLVTKLSETPLIVAKELAQVIAGKSPDAIRSAKKLLNRSPYMDEAAALRLEADLQKDLIGSPNQVEAVMANFQKRQPLWQVDEKPASPSSVSTTDGRPSSAEA